MVEEAILGYLEKNEEISDSGEFAAQHGLHHNEMVNVIKGLHGFRLVDAQDIKKETWLLTDEGKFYAAAASPEVHLFLAIPPEGILRDELQFSKLDVHGLARTNGWRYSNRSTESEKPGNESSTIHLLPSFSQKDLFSWRDLMDLAIRFPVLKLLSFVYSFFHLSFFVLWDY
ncbi:hypothetical protein Ancab_018107 [Ancistrocladus abbreviatus]